MLVSKLCIRLSGDNWGYVLLNLHNSICSEPSSELRQWVGLDEESQHMLE